MDILEKLLLALAFTLVGVAACTPEITGNTYYCGPEGLCPPSLACDRQPPRQGEGGFAFECVSQRAAESFSCHDDAADLEPDDEPATARDIGSLGCGSQILLSNWGCIDDADDRDHFSFSLEGPCSGGATLRVRLNYPIGAVPLQARLLGNDESTVATSVLCGDNDGSNGVDQSCIEIANPEPGIYTLGVEVASNQNADCDGNCAHNRYDLQLNLLL